MPTIDLKDIRFSWDGGPAVIDLPAFTVKAGDKAFLRGPSGSGKSTLLGIIAGVLDASQGNVHVLGEDLRKLSPGKRDQLRADRMGVIFQMFNLLPYLSVTQNVLLPIWFSPARAARLGGDPETEAVRLLERLGLSGERILNRKVTDLSVGQQQRVAAARALIGGPDLVIADEPTSALDEDARDSFIELLIEETGRNGATLLFVSHDSTLARHFDHAFDLASLNKAGATI